MINVTVTLISLDSDGIGYLRRAWPHAPVKTYSAATSGWDTVSAVLVAPSGATAADIRLNVSSLNATIYLDNLSFSTGTPPADTTPPTVTSKAPAGATSAQVGQNGVRQRFAILM